MKKYLFIIPLFVGLISCKTDQSKSEPNKKIIEKNTEKDDDSLRIIERFFPKNKEVVKTDTLIQSLNIQISIIKKTLDTFVTDEFESEGEKHIYKYRDFQNNLIIKSKDKILVDTLFTKESFLKYQNKEFLDIATFHGYWFNKIEANKIEFSGAISKPETDWSFGFKHFYDLTKNEFTVKENIDEY